MHWFCYSLPMIILVAVGTSAAQALPLVGWKAHLSQDFHNVSGTVSIFDEDTLKFDDFTFDGEGVRGYFYLGTEDSSAAFNTGLPIGTDLFGTVFDGTQDPFFIDLPGDQTIEGWNAISVWCIADGVSFGSDTFSLPGDFDGDGDVDGNDFLKWQRGESPNPNSASDLADWEANYGTIPEPATGIMLMLGLMVMLFRRHAFIS